MALLPAGAERTRVCLVANQARRGLRRYWVEQSDIWPWGLTDSPRDRGRMADGTVALGVQLTQALRLRCASQA